MGMKRNKIRKKNLKKQKESLCRIEEISDINFENTVFNFVRYTKKVNKERFMITHRNIGTCVVKF